MACNFDIRFNMTAEELVEKASRAIEASGGSFEGDTSSGTFVIKDQVTIEGEYTIEGQVLAVEITKKPFFVSCKRIKKEIGRLLREGAPRPLV